MIGTIRHYMQKSGAKAILWLTLFSLAGGSFIMMFQFSRRFKADSMGSVNDQEIGFMEFRRKYAETQRMMHEIRRMYGPQADMILKMWGLDKDPQEFVLESLISEKVIQSAADATGAQVSKEYLQTKLRDPYFVRQYLGNVIPPQALAGGTLDVAVLKQFLQHQNISEEEFEENVIDAMKRALLQHLIAGAVYVPRAAVKKAYERDYLKKRFATARIPFSEYVKKAKQEKITEGALDKYYAEHKEDYRIPEKRSARVWSFDPEHFGIQIADKDLESAYHKRKRSFVEKPEQYVIQYILFTFDKNNADKKIEMRKQAQEVLKQAKEKPETFEALAAKHSQSKDKGTTVTVQQGSKPGMFESTVAGLQPKEISPVIETADGFEIIKLISKKEPVFKPLAKVKDALLKSLKQEKFATEFNANAQRVISQASDLPEVFTTFIRDRKGHESTVTDVTAEGTPKSERIFGLAKKGDKAFYEDEGKGYIVELTNVIPSVIPPLTQVKEKIQQDMYNEKAHALAEADIAKVRAALKDKKNLKEAMRSLTDVKPEFYDTELLDTKNHAAAKSLHDKKLPVQKMAKLTTVHTLATDISPEQVSFAELLEIEPFKQEDFDKKKAQLEVQLRHQLAGPMQRGFVDALRARAKIDINKELLRGAGRGRG